MVIMFCKNCGNEIKDGMKLCSNCGAMLDVTSKIKETISLGNVTGNKYRFKCCYGGGHGRMHIIALPLFYAITYFTGDSVDFTFQESTIKIDSSNLDIEESYENINNIFFQDNVPFKRNFPFTVVALHAKYKIFARKIQKISLKHLQNVKIKKRIFQFKYKKMLFKDFLNSP